MANRKKMTDQLRAKFLEVLAHSANVSEAARATNTSNNRWYEEKNRGKAEGATEAQKQFSADWDWAVESAIDRLEREAWRRATEGVLEPVFYQGVECGEIRRYSDQMLGLLLRGHRSNRFKDRVSQEVSGPDGGPVPTEIVIRIVDPKGA